MAAGDKDTKDIKALKTQILGEVMDELNRREEELATDIYGSRDYSDGVRFEVGRMQLWLSDQMEK